jgi:hypothetical protein
MQEFNIQHKSFDAIVKFLHLLSFNSSNLMIIVPAGDALMQVPLEPSIDFMYGY